jgi:putative transcription factor
MAMQKARLAKKMSQADVAKQVNEKSTVINDYESGRAVPNPAIIQKLQKVLGCKLPKAQQPKKTKNLDDN